MNLDVNSEEPKWEFTDNKGKKTARTKIQLPYGFYRIIVNITDVSDDQIPIRLRDIVSLVKQSVLGVDPNASPVKRVQFTPKTEYSYSKQPERYKPPTASEGLTIEEREELEAITEKKPNERTPQEGLRKDELTKKGQARFLYESRVFWSKQPEDVPVAKQVKKHVSLRKQKPLTEPDAPEKVAQQELAGSSARYFALLTTEVPFSKAEWSDVKEYPIFFLDVEELEAFMKRLAEIENTVPKSEKELWETLNGKIYHCLKAKYKLSRFVALAHRLLARSRKRSVAQLCDKTLTNRRGDLISALVRENKRMQEMTAEFLPKNIERVEMDSGMLRLYVGSIEECDLLIHELVRLQSSIVAILAEDVFLKSSNNNWDLQVRSFVRHYASKYKPELKTKLVELLEKKISAESSD